MSQETSSLHLSPRRIALWLALAAGLLHLANIAGELYQHLFAWSRTSPLYLFTGKFLVSGEINFPSYFSALLLLACAALLGVIGSLRRRAGAPYARHWQVLAAIFVYLSVDEATALHEMLVRPLRRGLDLSGFLRFSWVVPAAILVLILALVYVRFVWALPARSRWLFVLAGALYVGGALGFEMIGGRIDEAFGATGVLYHAVSAAEEALEMAGTIIFIYALLDYIRSHIGASISLNIGGRAHADPTA